MLEFMNMTNAYNTSVATYSFYAIKKIESVTQDYLATGGMFMASIPVLTLFLLTGSVYALTSLTGRMAGADVINEKIASPDIMTPNALVQQQAMSTALNGVHTQPGVYNWKITTSTGGSYELSRARSNAVNASNAFMSQVGRAFSNISSDSQAVAYNEILSKTFSSLSKEAQNSVHELGKSLVAGTGQENNQALINSLGVAASLGGNVGVSTPSWGSKNGVDISKLLKASVNAGIKADAIARAQIQENLKSSEAMDLQKNIKSNQSIQSEISNAVANQLSNNRSLTNAISSSATESGSLQESANRVITAQENLSNAEKATSATGSQKEYTARELSMAFMANSSIKKHVRDYWNEHFDNDMDKQQLNAQISQMQEMNLLSGGGLFKTGDIETLARMQVMADGANDKNINAQRFMGNLLNDFNNGGIKQSNIDMAQNLNSPDTLGGKVDELGQVVTDKFNDSQEKAISGINKGQEPFKNAKEKVDEMWNKGQSNVNQASTENIRKSVNESQVRDQLKTISDESVQDVGNVLGSVQKGFEQLVRESIKERGGGKIDNTTMAQLAISSGDEFARNILGDKDNYEQGSEAYEKAFDFVSSLVAYNLYKNSGHTNYTRNVFDPLVQGGGSYIDPAETRLKESCETSQNNLHDFVIDKGFSEREYYGLVVATTSKLQNDTPFTNGSINNVRLARESIIVLDGKK